MSELSEKDFAPFCECDLRLTDEQIKSLRNMVYYRALLMRREGKWSGEEEAAFLNGAMCIFFACRCGEKIPAFWLMGSKPLLDTLLRWKEEGELTEGA